jgi:hypothetical protein
MGHVDVLELARDAFAQNRSKFDKVLSAVMLRSWFTYDARTFATTSLRSQPHACPARCDPRDVVVAVISSGTTVLVRRSKHIAFERSQRNAEPTN